MEMELFEIFQSNQWRSVSVMLANCSFIKAPNQS